MSVNTQHTPSWYVANTGNHQGLIVSEPDGRNVAVAYDKADAPLLAAAPELLQACEDMFALFHACGMSYTPEKTDALNYAKAAIAKAKGSQ